MNECYTHNLIAYSYYLFISYKGFASSPVSSFAFVTALRAASRERAHGLHFMMLTSAHERNGSLDLVLTSSTFDTFCTATQGMLTPTPVKVKYARHLNIIYGQDLKKRFDKAKLKAEELHGSQGRRAIKQKQIPQWDNTRERMEERQQVLQSKFAHTPMLTMHPDVLMTPVMKCPAKRSSTSETIWSAVQNCELQKVRAFLTSRKYTANEKNIHGNTPLYYCVQSARKHEGNPGKLGLCVKIGALLLHGGGSGETADINARNTIGETPLWLAAKFSSIMSALFKRYLKWRGSLSDDEYEFLLRAREMGLKREEKMVEAHVAWKRQQKESEERYQIEQARIQEQRHRAKQRHKKTQKTTARPKTASTTKPSEWRNGWSKPELFLANANLAATTQQKMVEWNRAIRVRDRLDLMKLKTVHAYDKKTANNIKNRLYRIEREKAIRKEMLGYHRQRPMSAFNKSRGRRDMLARVDKTEWKFRELDSLPAPNPVKQQDLLASPQPPQKTPIPAGFFKLDKEADIKEAFNILAGGKRYIDKNVLVKMLMQRGDCLGLDEGYRFLEKIEGFRLSDQTHRIDYEAFVETMAWISRQADIADDFAMSKAFKGKAIKEKQRTWEKQQTLESTNFIDGNNLLSC